MDSKGRKLTKKDKVSMFIRSNFLQGSWNFERMQSLGFCFAIIPAIRRLYEGEEREEALKRHLEFFNTHPFVASPILGVVSAMEEQKSNGVKIDDGVINGLKVGMMGPLAGVGDPIFWGTLRPVVAALGASIAMKGSLLGPILFFVIFNSVRLSFMWFTQEYGYKKGTNIIKEMGGNKLQKLTEGASILGLFVMGALVSKWTTLKISVVISSVTNELGKTTDTTVQTVLDQLLPGFIPLLLTFLCMKLLKKKINALWIIFGLFAVGIIGYAYGFLEV